MTDSLPSTQPGPCTSFRGRRRGRRLRPNLQRLLTERLPALRIVPGALQRDWNPAALFGFPVREVWMEVGFGAGEHLAWQAARHPDIGFIGCEPYINGVASLLRAVDAAGLGNIRILDDDVRPALAYFPAGSISRLFALFPDPWPKHRHRDRRLVQWESVAGFCRLLCAGGEMRLATDDPAYLRWMLTRLTAHPGLAWQARRPGDWRYRPPDWPQTRYEAKAIAAGRRPAFLRFCRRPVVQGPGDASKSA